MAASAASTPLLPALLPAHSLAFTLCQTPILYTRRAAAAIDVTYADGRQETIPGSQLDAATSRHIFERDGQIRMVQVGVGG